MTKVYPPIEAPTRDDLERAVAALFPNVEGIYSSAQRAAINAKAREFMLARKTKH